jgi:hypothetical protein
LAAITKKFFLPYLRDLWAADSLPYAEAYLQLDNGPGRGDEKFLKCLKEECKAVLDRSPADKTNYIQPIDDNCGRILRDLACDFIEEKVIVMDSTALKSISLAQKREIMVEAAQKAYEKWMDPNNDHFRAIGRRAALRTGLAMRIDNNCEGVRPVRFPEGYSATIPASSGAPVKSYFTTTPAVLVPPVVQVAIEPPGLGSAGLRIDLQQHPNGAIDLELRGEGVLSLQRESQPLARHQAEVGIYDGWSDEEERVFLAEEVDPSDDSGSSSDEEEGPRRRRERRRWCLLGCDCERERGRKCSCELRGDGLCSPAKCGCDSEKCRARLTSEVDE